MSWDAPQIRIFKGDDRMIENRVNNFLLDYEYEDIIKINLIFEGYDDANGHDWYSCEVVFKHPVDAITVEEERKSLVTQFGYLMDGKK